MLQTSKIIFTILCSATIIFPSVMDLNKTHMSNPQWKPHARFHWAIQYLSVTVVQCIALFLLWGNYADKNSILVTWFAGLSPIFFWGMFIPALLFPGTSTWPDGIEPPKGFPKVFKKIHPNIILSIIFSLTSIIGIVLDLKSR
ncbi:MAG TPA: DUF6640 family protein [Hanamia sp.]|nr:DUF6640 family protein [Hanamia sp.]